jgi:hypothetical protein
VRKEHEEAHRVGYREWLTVGSETLLVFEERMEEARQRGVRAAGPAVCAEYRAVDLFPAEGR